MCRPRFGSLQRTCSNPAACCAPKAPFPQTKKSAQEIDDQVGAIRLARDFAVGIEPAAAIAQRHDLECSVLNFLVVAGVVCGRYEDCVGQPFSCGIRSMPVPSKVIGNVGPCAIERSADDLERLGTVCATGQDLGSSQEPSWPKVSVPRPCDYLRACMSFNAHV